MNVALQQNNINDICQVDAVTERLTGTRCYSPDPAEVIVLSQIDAIENEGLAKEKLEKKNLEGEDLENKLEKEKFEKSKVETEASNLSSESSIVPASISGFEENFLFAEYLSRKFSDCVSHAYGLRFESRKDFTHRFGSCVGILLVKKREGAFEKIGLVIVSDEKRFTIDENDDEEDDKSHSEILLDANTDFSLKEWSSTSGTGYYKLDYNNFEQYVNSVLNKLTSLSHVAMTPSLTPSDPTDSHNHMETSSSEVEESDFTSSAEDSDHNLSMINKDNHPAAALGLEMISCIERKAILKKKTILTCDEPDKFCNYHVIYENDIMNAYSRKKLFDFMQKDIDELSGRFPLLQIPELYHYNTYRGYTISPKGFKHAFGYLAPCVLRSCEDTPGEDSVIVLLGIWKTRCSNPRIDIIVWDSALTSDKSVFLIKGANVGKFLRTRYCDLEAKFDIDRAFREYDHYLVCSNWIYDGVLPRDTKNPIRRKRELRTRAQILADQEALRQKKADDDKSRKEIRDVEEKQKTSQEESTSKNSPQTPKTNKRKSNQRNKDEEVLPVPRTRSRKSPLTVPKKVEKVKPSFLLQQEEEEEEERKILLTKRGRPPLPVKGRSSKRQAVVPFDLTSGKGSDSSEDEVLPSDSSSDRALSTSTFPSKIESVSSLSNHSPGIAFDYARLAREMYQIQQEQLLKTDSVEKAKPQTSSQLQQKIEDEQSNALLPEVLQQAILQLVAKNAVLPQKPQTPTLLPPTSVVPSPSTQSTTAGLSEQQQTALSSLLPFLNSILPQSQGNSQASSAHSTTLVKNYYFS